MLFSSVDFLYYFLPVLLIVYFTAPHRFKNLTLLLFSLAFYYYGEPVYSVLLVFSSVSGYLHGRMIDHHRGTKKAKAALVSSVVISVGLLMFFKYSNFLIGNVNNLFGSEFSLLPFILPIGISFYTFQILSYTIDVYRGTVSVQRKLLDFMTYVALFPQLIAGPIVRYKTIEAELKGREHSLEDVYRGISRFVFGLAKKVLIANTLAEVGAHFAGMNEATVLFYWMAAIAFMLQIYYDFSGYSDMAIGLGRIFGFHFLENFNYPYIAKSITEFWRRWHISLGQWFRNYVYIPLGGNRVNLLLWARNILIVWFLTGFWHGAAWNFIVWGMFFAVFLLVEKFLLRGMMERIPKIVRHAYVLFVVLIGFVVFNAGSMTEAIGNLQGMFGFSNIPLVGEESLYYLRNYLFVFLIACVGATPLLKDLAGGFRRNRFVSVSTDMLEPALYVLLLLMVTGNLIDGSFNPFLYFRF